MDALHAWAAHDGGEILRTVDGGAFWERVYVAGFGKFGEMNDVDFFDVDHGLAVGSHGLLGKQNLYEHSMRAPLILAGPGIPEGRRDDRFAYLFELHPTLCELAGIELPEGSGVEGRSLLGAGGGRRGSVFTAYKGVQRAVRDGRWKLIRYPRIDRTQLFDLAADPHETRDLAGDPAHVVDRWRLTGLLGEWQASVGDAQPLAVGDPLPAGFVPPRGSGARASPSTLDASPRGRSSAG